MPTADDLEQLHKCEELEVYLNEQTKPVDCIRVDGASDEGPSHIEVQYHWTARHIKYSKMVTLVTSRHSGGSYLNRVELMNGGIAQAHSNLFIPSTTKSSNYGPEGHDQSKLTENLQAAVDIYIDHVEGASCCGTPILLQKGGSTDKEKRQQLLVFLKGTKKAKMELQDNLERRSPWSFQRVSRCLGCEG